MTIITNQMSLSMLFIISLQYLLLECPINQPPCSPI